jgi:hypothetical protein
MDTEKLRRFYFSMERVPVIHRADDLEEICTEYWEWTNGQWNNYNEWYTGPDGKLDTPVVTRGCETGHAWKCLLEVARIYGYNDHN